MSLGYRKSSKLSLSVSLFWIVGLLALLIRASNALPDGQQLLAADKEENLLLVLPKGNGKEVNKTLRFDGEKEEIVFIVHRPGPSCLAKNPSFEGNIVEFWLGNESCKMNFTWSDDAFRLGKGDQKLIMMPTESNATVTLKKEGNAIVSYKKKKEDAQEITEEIKKVCPFDLNGNPNTSQDGKIVLFGMKGDTNCGMTLEFLNTKEAIVSTTPAPSAGKKNGSKNNSSSSETGKGSSSSEKGKGSPSTKEAENKGLAPEWLVLIIAGGFLVLLSIIAIIVAVVYFWKGRQKKNGDLESQMKTGIVDKSAALSAWKKEDASVDGKQAATAKESSKPFKSVAEEEKAFKEAQAVVYAASTNSEIEAAYKNLTDVEMAIGNKTFAMGYCASNQDWDYPPSIQQALEKELDDIVGRYKDKMQEIMTKRRIQWNWDNQNVPRDLKALESEYDMNNEECARQEEIEDACKRANKRMDEYVASRTLGKK